jgi:tetratricopeptide (TPR) repeat protein
MNHTCPSRWVHCALPLLVIFAAAAGQQPDPESPAHPWSTDVLDALRLYRHERYIETQQRCRQLLANERLDAAARRDAAVLNALSLLRSPARDDRVQGRGWLKQLAQTTPSLQAEPECLLALGDALSAMNETTHALDLLDRAAAGFARQDLPRRQLAALQALALAWARHEEWQAVPARFPYRPPRTRPEAHVLRLSQVQAVRERVSRIRQHEPTLAAIDLVLARYLLENDERAHAVSLLERLAQPPLDTPTAAESALLLAPIYEQDGQPDRARRLYQALAQRGPRDAARTAREWLQSLNRAQLEIDAPASAPPGIPVPITVCARNIDHAALEVRQVDVDDWIGSAARRGVDKLLPESGSLRLAQSLDLTAETPPAVTLVAEAGAYAIIARASDDQGAALLAKRLIVLTDLHVNCFVGRRHALLWAFQPGVATRAADETTARFWMQRSFTPTNVLFDGDVARFALPAEAFVMRDRDWVCVVRRADQLAVCRGRLPRSVRRDKPTPRIVGAVAPAEPRPGDAIRLAGLLLDHPPNASNPPPALTLTLRDTLERVLLTPDLDISAGGAFQLEIPVTTEMTGRHFRIAVTSGSRVVPDVGGRLVFSVAPASASRYRVQSDLPRLAPPGTPNLATTVRAARAWGPPLPLARLQTDLRVTPLPTSRSNGSVSPGDVARLAAQLDGEGQVALDLPLWPRDVIEPPYVLDVRFSVATWDGGQGSLGSAVLVADQSPHTWLAHDPPLLTVGAPARFTLGWYDPLGLCVDGQATLVIQRENEASSRLPLQPGPRGLVSAPCTFNTPGEYALTAIVPRFDKAALEIVEQRTVLPASETAPTRATTCQCTATRDAAGRPAARVTLSGPADPPMLVLVEAGDILAARALPSAPRSDTLILPLPEPPPAATRVHLLGFRGGEIRHLHTAGVLREPGGSAVCLRLPGGRQTVRPGTTVPVSVENAGERSATHGAFVARLVDARSTGYATPRVRLGRALSLPEAPPVVLTSHAGKSLSLDDKDAVAGGPSRSVARDAWWASLLDGQTLWASAGSLSDGALDVPIPVEPGIYRLLLAARYADGAVETDSLLLDARDDLHLHLDAPFDLQIGDRTFVAIELRNSASNEITGQLNLDAGDKLLVESVRLVREDRRTMSSTDPHAIALELPPRERVWAYAEFEAARAGAGVVTVEVERSGTSRTARTPFHVEASAPTPPHAPITIQRSLAVLVEPEKSAPPASLERETPSNQRAQPRPANPWYPGDRLTVGQILRVRETVTVNRRLAAVTWTQPAPANGAPVAREPESALSIGRREADVGTALRFKTPTLEPGQQIHEYLVVVTRPGACTLPPPDVTADGQALPVRVVPDETRVVSLAR